jgi:carbonic anhydrase
MKHALVRRLAPMLAAALLLGFAAGGEGADRAAWSYAGANGPAKWAKLDKEYATCGSGELQAPIDIPDAKVRKGDIPPILFNYKPSPLAIVDDGHTIRVNIAPGSRISVEGGVYELTAIEFHKPAEVKVDGKAAEMSAHLLHKNKDGRIAIVAVPLEQGKENQVLKTLWSNLPVAKGKEVVVDSVKVNPVGLLPSRKDYYMFAGSLTTPPCSENVKWMVLMQPVQVSGEQIRQFAKLYPMNARPVQALNDRDIQGSSAR